MNNVYTLARVPGGQMRGAATQAMPVRIVEERQRSRCPPAGLVARSLYTTSGMLVARASPAGLGPAAKCKRYSLTGP